MVASNLTDVPLFMKCQINNQLTPNLAQHTPGSPWGKPVPPTTSQLHLFCTTWSLFRTILYPAGWWLSPSCDSYFAVEMWAQMSQITNTAWKNICGTLAVRLQQRHPCEWQDYDYDGSQAKQNYHCIMAGVELDRCATVHEMSNQHSLKQSFPNTNLDRLGKLVATYNFVASPCCTTSSLFRTILDFRPC